MQPPSDPTAPLPIDEVLLAVRLGMAPAEACRRLGVRPTTVWYALVVAETYHSALLSTLTQAQRKAFVQAVLRDGEEAFRR